MTMQHRWGICWYLQERFVVFPPERVEGGSICKEEEGEKDPKMSESHGEGRTTGGDKVSFFLNFSLEELLQGGAHYWDVF